MKRFLVPLLLLLPFAGFAQDPAPAPIDPPVIVPGKGLKLPDDLDEQIKASWLKHGKRLQALPKATVAKYDCCDLGIVPPIRNQGSCGSCWDVSACDVLTCSLIKAGWFKNDGSLTISDQYILDNCGPRNGGCNGDWSATVTTWALNHGIPTTQDYGPYKARSERCHSSGNLKLYKIDSQGYCASENGVAPTQSIKDAIVAYGPVSAAVDAGGMSNYRGGIIGGDGRNVDHAISIVGWDDNKGPGCWKVRNQWGADWGENGYCWIPYGKWQIGYAALWVHATPVDPPPPVPPVPPVPPTPGNFTPPFYVTAPTIKGPFADQSAAHVAAQAEANGCTCPATVKDSKAVLVETVQPSAPVPPTPSTQLIVTVAGTYQLVSPKTAEALKDSGLTLDQYIEAAERARGAFRLPTPTTVEPPIGECWFTRQQKK